VNVSSKKASSVRSSMTRNRESANGTSAEALTFPRSVLSSNGAGVTNTTPRLNQPGPPRGERKMKASTSASIAVTTPLSALATSWPR
jgi:hypothetical protein